MRKKFRVVVNGKEYVVEVEELDEREASVPVRKAAVPQRIAPKSSAPERSVERVEGAVTAPMPGKIQRINVSVGDSVKAGDVLLILEAMKMENEIVAPKDGTVKEILVSPGDTVDKGSALVVIE